MTDRAILKKQYRGLYEELTEIFFKHDPVGIDLETNPDEYEPEVATVIPRLASAKDINDVVMILFEEFTRWFGDSAGKREYYEDLATDVWRTWQNYKSNMGR